ncbi:Zinc finger, CCHC-type [Metarhizium album ARSEF 1941]|uniref:Zinc finger, CCHC-type n=1 Tax=Metarhizium album (strain ARSEF 1941) TaxID=1081103 RepID=A0A0B2WL94_METAS|nr:Zinc finger, CCHC-type [Metarhizium album ARSEF 1941]KHN93770.1 Zinc finger, CCHC-type [Metarhizium album ARSEF 1941]
MSTPAPGQHGQPDEPQCYNCGTVGHWAVACPEPTRETPAGLAAWRNSSTPNQTNPKGQGPGSIKRSKGPIITKYGPPPPPPPPSFAQGMNHMPPPPPGHHHHPHPVTSYPGQAPPYQAYAPVPPPVPPAYGGNFPPAAYGYSHPPPPHHPHHHHPPFQPPPPHGASHFGPPGYMGPPTTLGPPPGGHFAVNRGDGLENRVSAHDQAFSQSPPPLKPSPPMNATPPQNRSGPRQTPGLAKPPNLPSKPPVGVTSHPLPPKPPKSHDQSIQQHDHRNKRKNERHNKSRDRRQSNDHYNHRHPNPGSNHHGHPNQSPDNRRLSGSRKGQRQHHANVSSKSHTSRASSSDQHVAGAKGTNNGRRAAKDLGHRRQSSENIPRYHDDSRSAAKKTNRPFGANSQGSSVGVEMADNKGSPQLNNCQARSDISDGSERRSSSDHRGIGAKRFHHQDTHPHERQYKRPKIDASPRTETKPLKSDGEEEHEEEECIWDNIDVPREADRRQQAERDRSGAKRRASTASRASSQSSRSSDLNSLEAELLGRPVKQQKSPEKSSTRHRQDHQAKRRPVNTNSAYSRRW